MTNVQKFLKNMVHTDDLESWLIDDMRRIFYKFDTSGDGQLQWDEFVEAMKELSSGMTELDIINLFDAMDVDHNHSIDVDEFLQQYAFQHAIKQDDRLWAVCKSIDLSDDGKLDHEDLDEFIRCHPDVKKGMTRQMKVSLDNLFARGSISYHTFICAMVEGKPEDLENTTDELMVSSGGENNHNTTKTPDMETEEN
jgi:Ca2+-binding EF-hand superfamily protein